VDVRSRENYSPVVEVDGGPDIPADELAEDKDVINAVIAALEDHAERPSPFETDEGAD
jgi:hypothetical protein